MRPKTVGFAVYLNAALMALAAEAPTPKPRGLELKFGAYDGSPDKVENMNFQINLVGLRASFFRIGDVVAGTKLRLHEFISKK